MTVLVSSGRQIPPIDAHPRQMVMNRCRDLEILGRQIESAVAQVAHPPHVHPADGCESVQDAGPRVVGPSGRKGVLEEAAGSRIVTGIEKVRRRRLGSTDRPFDILDGRQLPGEPG